MINWGETLKKLKDLAYSEQLKKLEELEELGELEEPARFEKVKRILGDFADI